MTVQELLLQDSDVIIPIGAAKLQEIILTLRSFKEKAELLTINQKKLGDALISRCAENIRLHAEVEHLKNTKMRCHSIDLDIGDLLWDIHFIIDITPKLY